MVRAEALGEFEHLVLLAIVRLATDAYGSTIRREIEERTGRRLRSAHSTPRSIGWSARAT